VNKLIKKLELQKVQKNTQLTKTNHKKKELSNLKTLRK